MKALQVPGLFKIKGNELYGYSNATYGSRRFYHANTLGIIRFYIKRNASGAICAHLLHH